MGRAVVSGVFLVCVTFVSASSRSDDASVQAQGSAADEPITGTPVTPLPGSASPRHEPFTPYDVGPAEAMWNYNQLAPEEQVIVDRGRDTTGWNETNAAFAGASRELAQQAAANSSATQLGVDHLDEIGVAP